MLCRLTSRNDHNTILVRSHHETYCQA
jgi:hypothetical protein